jgi:hypothetical protein
MELFEAHHIKPDMCDERCAGHAIKQVLASANDLNCLNFEGL